MNLLVRLAWRNLWRNRRRSFLTIAAILFATSFTTLMRGLGVGTWEFNVRNTVELFSGYLQVQRAGYQANPSLAKYLAYDERLEEVLKGNRRVSGYAPRIVADGLVSYNDKSSGASIIAVDVRREATLSRLHERVKAGTFLRPDHRWDAVLGHRLLDRLKAGIGDTIVVLAQGADGVLGNLLFRVCGSAKLGIPEVDGAAVFMHLAAAQELLALEGRVHMVAVGVRSLKDVEPAVEELTGDVGRRGARGLAVLPWEEVLPDLKQSMEFDRIGDWFFLGILIVIVTFGILNTVLMSVTERFREFGVVLSLGMANRQLAALVFLETLMMAFIGTLLGGVLGHLGNVYLALNPIMLSGDFASIYEEYGFIPQVMSSTNINIALIVSGVVMLIALLVSAYPIHKVRVLEPLKGIRYT